MTNALVYPSLPQLAAEFSTAAVGGTDNVLDTLCNQSLVVLSSLAGNVLAGITDLSGNPIAGSVITADRNGRLPQFKDPMGRTALYIQRWNGLAGVGPIVPVFPILPPFYETPARSIVRWYSNSGVLVHVPSRIPMRGFRFQGQYPTRYDVNPNGLTFGLPNPSPQIVQFPGDLGAETTAHTDNWYAIFACANSGDTNVAYKLMPFLRVGSVAGSIVTLALAGMVSPHSFSPTTYAWTAANALANVDCLVITEQVAGRINAFKGRVTKITANDNSAVTLADIGTLGTFGDFLLPAPPNFMLYEYLGCFYADVIQSPMDIADAGSLVKFNGVQNADGTFSPSGAVDPDVEIHCGGYISPLATAAVMEEDFSVSAGVTGFIVTDYFLDGPSTNHNIHTVEAWKPVASSNLDVAEAGIVLPFAYKQTFFWKVVNAGIAPQRILGKLLHRGWIEP